MLQAKVSDLSTPPEEERRESQHGGDVANANVADVDTSDEDSGVRIGQRNISQFLFATSALLERKYCGKETDRAHINISTQKFIAQREEQKCGIK